MHTGFPNIPIMGSSQMTSSDKVPNSIWAHPHLQKMQAKHRWVVSQTYSRQKRVKQDKTMHELIVHTMPTIYMHFTVHCAVCSL